jgi:hypothetical protein
LIREFTDNHQKQCDLGSVVANIEAVLHQGANRAIFMAVKVVMMVLRDREQSRKQQNNDDCPENLHLKITRSAWLHFG